MDIHTIGYGQKSAEAFFGLLKAHGIRRVIDIRRHNTSQLAAYTKRGDLAWFLRQLLGAEYVHELQFAPTEEMLAAYRKQGGTWDEYEAAIRALLAERRIEETVDRSLFDVPSVLLCSEPTPEHCHRRVVAEYLAEHWGDVNIIHL